MYRSNFFLRLVKRSEFGSVIALAVLWILFSIIGGGRGFNSLIIFKSILDISVSTGIIGVIATLLLISGEFDLSVGSMIGATGFLLALSIVEWGLPLWLALIVIFSFAILYGFLQGLIVVKGRLPSIIVTLGGLFFLRGLTFGISITVANKSIIGAIDSNLQNNWLYYIFAGKFFRVFNVSIIWWIVTAAIAYYILKKTRFGNWIFATGGNEPAARALGVPTDRVKIILFVATSASVALLAALQVLEQGSADTLRGRLKEFEVVITMVIGGTLISGGYGSPIGTFFGALTIGLLRQGIYMIGIPEEWYQAVLGIVLIIAVLINRTGQRLERL